jgi:hypothetical protein
MKEQTATSRIRTGYEEPPYEKIAIRKLEVKENNKEDKVETSCISVIL